MAEQVLSRAPSTENKFLRHHMMIGGSSGILRNTPCGTRLTLFRDILLLCISLTIYLQKGYSYTLHFLVRRITQRRVRAADLATDYGG